MILLNLGKVIFNPIDDIIKFAWALTIVCVHNLQEARALLGRYEYQKGNVEASLHVFEGIDISMVAPKIKSTLSRRGGERRRSSFQNMETPSLSIHVVSLILEAIFLKSKSLQALGRGYFIFSV